jgi:hypothetical protein
MDTIEPRQGWASEPQPKKKMTWIWIVVAVLVLCMCLAALGAGLYFFLNIRSEDVSTDQPGGSDYPPVSTTAPFATMFPTPTERLVLPTTLVIEPLIVGEAAHNLYLLISDFEDASLPGVRTWDVSVSNTWSVGVYQSWCTTTTAILDQNFQHIQITFEADGETVDMDSLSFLEETQTDRVCRGYYGIVRAWPLGDHVIIINMAFDEPINDGWDDYPAGDYIEQFIINATP